MKSLIDQEKLQSKLEDNREMLIPIAILFIAIMLFVVFILPNILSFPTKKSDRDTEVAKLNQIKEAEKILGSIDEEKLNSDFELVTKTLPSDKNFELILGAISEAATKSNVQIANYLFNDSDSPSEAGDQITSGLDFEIGVIGGMDSAAQFANELYMTYPISNVKSIAYSNGISKILVTFYYKPFITSSSEDVALAREKTVEEAKALEAISEWSTGTAPIIETSEPEPVDESAIDVDLDIASEAASTR